MLLLSSDESVAHSVVCCMGEWVPCYLAGMKSLLHMHPFGCTLKEQERLAVAVIAVVEAVVEHPPPTFGDKNRVSLQFVLSVYTE